MYQRQSRTQKLVGVSVLAAASLIISFFSFPIIPAAPFLKMDFGDIPILLGMFAYGPGWGIIIAFLRSFMHYLFTAGEGGIPIGDFAAFIASVALTLPIFFILKNWGSKKLTQISAGLSGAVSLTIVLSALNYFVLIPVYQAVMNFDVGPMRDYLVGAVIPFNMAKGLIVALVFFAVWKVMKPWIERQYSSRNAG
ncbi:MAG: ECF transporter S component [Atopococcus tabaci]|uniref:Riboflavin transporter n=1 Tax=Atopococcus tabaci TaxID=269774 RepID=A0AA43RLR7_9LACT|nr:ECF transporter S component [Atopococcus tabaci]